MKGSSSMIDELITMSQLEQIKRLLDGGRVDLASAVVESMIEQRQKQVDQFEADLFDNLPV